MTRMQDQKGNLSGKEAPPLTHLEKDLQQVEKDECMWCHSKTHRKKDCPDFLKHLLKKGEEIITFIDET